MGTLLASIIFHWMLTGYSVMNRSKRKVALVDNLQKEHTPQILQKMTIWTKYTPPSCYSLQVILLDNGLVQDEPLLITVPCMDAATCNWSNTPA